MGNLNYFKSRVKAIYSGRTATSKPAQNANYEIMVVHDDTLNQLHKNREIYTISENKPNFDFALFVNVGSTTIITAKLASYEAYNSLQEIKQHARIDAVEVGPKLSIYYLHKYVMINADVNREFKNGVFSHYIVDHELLIPE
ncbi:hypothetical protein F-VV10_0285 [Faustovirus]|nr:hypothetical protein F-VV10_0285 [Faustovirus]